MQIKTTLVFIIVITLVIGVIVFISTKVSAPKYDTQALAQCLVEKQVTFYGAWWCSHCKATKDLFGAAAKSLPYVECSADNPQEQLQVCIDKKIESYPTWEFSDGSRLTGERSLEELAFKANCPLLPAKKE